MCNRTTAVTVRRVAGAGAGGKTPPPPPPPERATVEEALSVAGFGRYNYLLLALCSWMLQAMGMDMFGSSLTVAAAACDLRLTLQQQGLLTAIPFMGVLAGAHAWGYVSDTRGRKVTLAVSMSGGFVFASLSALAPDWKTLAAIKFCSSCFTSATNSAAYTLLGESCPAGARARAMLLMSCALMMSQGVSAMVAYPILPLQLTTLAPRWLSGGDDTLAPAPLHSWRLLALALAAPCGITALLLYFFHESPKFLASRGRHCDALDVLRRMYAANTGDLPDNFPVKKLAVEDSEDKEAVSPLRALWRQTAPLFRAPLLQRTVPLFYLAIVVYSTGSGFIMWLPYVMNKMSAVLSVGGGGWAGGGGGGGLNMCAVLRYAHAAGNSTAATAARREREVCTDTVEETTLLAAAVYGALACGVSVLMSLVSGVQAATAARREREVCTDTVEETTLLAAAVYGALACGVSVLMSLVSARHKKLATLVVLSVSCASALLLNLVHVALANVFFFFSLLMIALSMGILSVYFVELYPTHLRGMVSCLSVMVGRTAAFAGVNVIGSLLVSSCELTFYIWAVLILSAVVCAATCLPADSAGLGGGGGGTGAAAGADRGAESGGK